MRTKLENVKPETLNEFWSVVETLGWGAKSARTETIKLKLMGLWRPEKAEEMREVFSALSGRLYKALDKVVQGVGDDSFDDLRAHIIGLGKDEFERVLANPSLAQKRIDADDYVESFAYCLPFKDDYETLTPAYYVEWAKKICAELKNGFKDDRFEPVFPQMQKLIDLFLPAAEGDPLAVIPKENEAKALRAEIEKRGKWLWRDAAFLDGGHFAVSASVNNYFLDVKRYLSP